MGFGELESRFEVGVTVGVNADGIWLDARTRTTSPTGTTSLDVICSVVERLGTDARMSISMDTMCNTCEFIMAAMEFYIAGTLWCLGLKYLLCPM